MIEKLKESIPGLVVVVDRPATEQAPWWVDLELNGHSASIEWRPGLGFGVSSSDSTVLGEGSDEVYPDVQATLERTTKLFLDRERTRPPERAALRELRGTRKMSQADLAERLNVRQAAISKLEARPNVGIDTLRSAIEAMGGHLELRARFSDEIFEIAQSRRARPKSDKHR
ncbi:MAG: helix-turn-helix transcriptional regulator [Dehalococcoidia bacterium]